ncbi:unnamed protein product [Penicillium salamii]|uniref:Uncharacterized protein n=1 Tax=Penicillium salamii TaxID=1612424 RepID=A0A9W4ICB6_9EURO|nr:unnamed protein product [Penicillium salamii]CAG8035410.1 unnamed protein product [Penicillium salamii]CAG8088464.1 unnamed protein product [Penicillium salamii]CAG8166055.1 unnamed protein product [Penicillium salamii]CAG8204751.1 unnamed protein product [Penicillium salamii]
MAIWPFGRKSKRHTIQVTGAEATDLQSSLPQEATIAPTLGRKPSKRQHRSSREDHRRNSALVPSNRPISSLDHPSSLADHSREHPPSRTGSLLRRKPSQQNGPNKLRRKLSKRKANEIMREREIRMLSSTPIDIPHRQTAGGGDYVLDHRRRKGNERRADRYMSDISLSIRDSAASSASDMSDPYTYKVNAFAALTPRPVVRYVEAPRLHTAKSNRPASTRQDKERLAALTRSEEDLYYSRRRVNELADSLDAGALRELLDRDRRRREKKQLDDQEKLRRKLQERADAQQAREEQAQVSPEHEPKPAQPEPSIVDTEPSITEPEPSVAEQPVTESQDIPMEDDTIIEVEEPTPIPHEHGSWLRGESKGSDHARESLDSARVIGNIDDSSLRERRLIQRPSFAPSHDMALSRTTLSPSHSSIRHGVNSPSHSHTLGAGSTSDISRGIDSRRSSDTSGRRGNTITSLFRRGSSRIKRRYKERFQEPSPEVSNTSHESFYKVSTQSSPPPASLIPPRVLMPSEPIQRSHSKFTEHFGDEPLSPPDSRLQSPDIPEEVLESSLEREDTFLRGPSPTPGVDIQNPNRSHHRSWTSELIDAEADNVPLSQSLASIDSEGSWMSGQFFKRMSQNPSSPIRSNLNTFGRNSADVPADALEDIKDMDEPDRPDSPVGDAELGVDSDSTPAERWHNEVGRRPVVITPASRPKSTQGLLRNFPSLTPISAEEDYIVAESPSELQRIPSAKAEIGYAE